jgi:hypothetical protein
MASGRVRKLQEARRRAGRNGNRTNRSVRGTEERGFPGGTVGVYRVFEGECFSEPKQLGDKCFDKFRPTRSLLETCASIRFQQALNCIVHQFGVLPKRA